ncbi:MAG: SDR family oxidoreductase [Alphaproteobacteria bacterium]|jgi:NAD(P)-dependent dehydrogenase (short-subunit alcohol dehydrogenase family)|nr:SDR family oxidoreductase [Alphaproteobacteria bacterium]MDP6517257.1 SDR family oxidoreductase [Alphaproteobacteria bacterium]
MSDKGDMFDLSGKVALVTGSSRGIGKAIVEAMATQGAKVVVSSRKADACQEVAEGIVAAGGEAIAVPCNISHHDQLQALVDATVAAYGGIDVLVCNAAVNPYYGPLSEVPESAYDKIMDTNVKSNLWLCNMVIPGMAERGGGAVIIVSSVAAFKGSAILGTYGLSKAADVALARNLAVEWGHKNVRVNCLNPSIIRTDFARALWENPEIYARAVETYALGRIGEPEEVAGVAVMLAAKAGSFITGQAIVVDGGSTIFAG